MIARCQSFFGAMLLCGIAGCSAHQDADVHAVAVQREMKLLITTQIDAWAEASRALHAAAPVPSGRGWDAAQDASAIAAMRADWHRARTAYEQIEGAIAPLFPESDLATDARYDDYLSTLGSGGDPAPFDDQGVIGMHAIERILWANEIPAVATDFEKGVPGYRAAAMPATEADARAFKDQLAQRMLRDVAALQTQFASLDLDLAFAFRGLIDLAAEQIEKVDRAATGQEESRYAQATLKDLRANRKGCLDAYRVFRPWLLQKPGGGELDRGVSAAFDRLQRAYDAVPGDAIPQPPADFRRLEPSAQQLATPFGAMFSAVQRESDEHVTDSLRSQLLRVAERLELPKIVGR
jgi:iron uptake system component EfeO